MSNTPALDYESPRPRTNRALWWALAAIIGVGALGALMFMGFSVQSTPVPIVTTVPMPSTVPTTSPAQPGQ